MDENILSPHHVLNRIDMVVSTWKAWGKEIQVPVYLLLKFWSQAWAEMPTWPAQRTETADQESCGMSVNILESRAKAVTVAERMIFVLYLWKLKLHFLAATLSIKKGMNKQIVWAHHGNSKLLSNFMWTSVNLSLGVEWGKESCVFFTIALYQGYYPTSQLFVATGI